MEKSKVDARVGAENGEQVEILSLEIGQRGAEKHIYRMRNEVYQHLIVVDEADGKDGLAKFNKVIKG